MGTEFMLYSQQVSISGIANNYLMADSVLSDRIRVIDDPEVEYFMSGDKILVIQMTGGEVYDGTDFKTTYNRTQKTFNNTGSFEVLELNEVITEGVYKYLVFTHTLSKEYDHGEKIQLVRFVEAATINVSEVVTAKSWDGNSGGIVALIGTDSIVLEANIDVSYQGFRGGLVPLEDYTGGCRQDLSETVTDTLYFLPTETNRSGNKGEGIITASWPYTKGAGFALNGGGAGNGLYSGGAGGSNCSQGGSGGAQSDICIGFLEMAWGGISGNLLYSDNRIIMGGGGGSGVKNDSENKAASPGGNGGGIIILITETLVGNGKSLLANGMSSFAVNGSGGGGGAGGTILVDASIYSGTLFANAKGGAGGATDDNCTGSGGGGSGGSNLVCRKP